MIIKDLLKTIKVESMRAKQDPVYDEGQIEYFNIKIALISVLETALNKAEKEKKAPLTPDEEYKVVKRAREDAEAPLNVLKQEGKEHLFTKEARHKMEIEIDHLDAFLREIEPHTTPQLSEADIAVEIMVLYNELKAGDESRVFTKRETGLFMKELKVRLAGQADMKTVSKVLATILV